MRSDIERGESLPVPLPPVQQKYLKPGRLYREYPRATPGDSWKQEEFSLKGYTPAKLAGMGRQPEAGGNGLNEKTRLFDPPFLKH